MLIQWADHFSVCLYMHSLNNTPTLKFHLYAHVCTIKRYLINSLCESLCILHMCLIYRDFKFYTSQKSQNEIARNQPDWTWFWACVCWKWVAFYNLAYKPVFSLPSNHRFSSTAYGSSLALPALLHACN